MKLFQLVPLVAVLLSSEVSFAGRFRWPNWLKTPAMKRREASGAAAKKHYRDALREARAGKRLDVQWNLRSARYWAEEAGWKLDEQKLGKIEHTAKVNEAKRELESSRQEFGDFAQQGLMENAMRALDAAKYHEAELKELSAQSYQPLDPKWVGSTIELAMTRAIPRLREAIPQLAQAGKVEEYLQAVRSLKVYHAATNPAQPLEGLDFALLVQVARTRGVLTQMKKADRWADHGNEAAAQSALKLGREYASMVSVRFDEHRAQAIMQKAQRVSEENRAARAAKIAHEAEEAAKRAGSSGYSSRDDSTDLMNPANPFSPLNPMNPANPANPLNPLNPASPISIYDKINE